MKSKNQEYEIPSNWTFENQDIAKAFDRHVREQLPWYDLLTGAVAHLIRHYLPHKGLIYDIGASTGNIGRSIEALLKDRDAFLIPIEPSAEMRELYFGPGKENLLDAKAHEICFERFDVAVLFLVMMFIPISNRKILIDSLYEMLNEGGCIIIVDKEDICNAYLGTIFRRLTMAGKVSSGVPTSEIVAKELSLSGVQRPINDQFIAHIKSLGAKEFFRFGEFSGWIIEK